MIIHFVPQRLGLFDERGREGPEWPDWLGALMRRMGGNARHEGGGTWQLPGVLAQKKRPQSGAPKG